MVQLFFDIETLPQGDYPDRDEVKIPKNITKLETIENYIDRNIEDTFRKRALVPHEGRIFCIGGILCVADKEDMPFMITGVDNNVVINNFWELITTQLVKKDWHNIEFIGHNIMDFDMPFIFLNTLKYAKKFSSIVPSKGHRMVDTMREFSYHAYGSNAYIKLETACKFFDIDVKSTDLDGSKVYDYYLDGRTDEIKEYCMEDVRAVKKLYHKMF